MAYVGNSQEEIFILLRVLASCLMAVLTNSHVKTGAEHILKKEELMLHGWQ